MKRCKKCGKKESEKEVFDWEAQNLEVIMLFSNKFKLRDFIFYPFHIHLVRQGVAWPGLARQGKARQGKARQGMARHGKVVIL